MRAICTWILGAALMVAWIAAIPGCGSAVSELEKPPDTTKQVNPMTDMPGFKEQQEKLKKAGKIK